MYVLIFSSSTRICSGYVHNIRPSISSVRDCDRNERKRTARMHRREDLCDSREIRRCDDLKQKNGANSACTSLSGLQTRHRELRFSFEKRVIICILLSFLFCTFFISRLYIYFGAKILYTCSYRPPKKDKESEWCCRSDYRHVKRQGCSRDSD